MVPTETTKGTVYLSEAHGYNNGVKLLNDVRRHFAISNVLVEGRFIYEGGI